MDENPETQTTESRFRKHGPAIFWGAMIALPVINLGAAYYGYHDTKMKLELVRLVKETAQ